VPQYRYNEFKVVFTKFITHYLQTIAICVHKKKWPEVEMTGPLSVLAVYGDKVKLVHFGFNLQYELSLGALFPNLCLAIYACAMNLHFHLSTKQHQMSDHFLPVFKIK